MDGWCRMGLDDAFLIKQVLPFGAWFWSWAQFSMKKFVNYIVYVFPREGLALPWGFWIGTWEIIFIKREETSRAAWLCSIVVIGTEYSSCCSV